MINFVASDYSALEPFEAGSAAVRTLKALYIIIITVLFLNTLIAILNLKIKRADKNAAGLYHLQMASLQVQIELGLLSASERARHDWFPEWFSYSMTETEGRVWRDFVGKNALRWDEENDFGEEKDHAPRALVNPDDEGSTRQVDRATAPATTAARPETSQITTTQTDSPMSTPTTTSSAPAGAQTPTTSTAAQATGSTTAESPTQQAAAATKSAPLIIHNRKLVGDLLSELKPFDASQLPDPNVEDDGGDDLDINNEQAYEDVGEWDDAEETGGGGASSSMTVHPPAVLTAGAANVLPATAPHDIAAPTGVTTASGSAAAVDESIELADMTGLSCEICGRPGSRCVGCKAVAYCSKEHQRKDWKRHKSTCRGKERTDNTV